MEEELTSRNQRISCVDLTKYYKGQEGKIRTSSKVEGVELMKNVLFQTELVQTFLQELHEGLNDAYQKNACYVGDMGNHIYHFYNYGIDMAVSQHSSSEFSGKCDRNGPVESMHCPLSLKAILMNR